MKEIGGYMGFEVFQGQEYHSSAIALNYGRNCLAYLIETKNIKKIYLPVFLCDSIKEVCEKYNVKCEYYRIDEKFHPIFSKRLSENEYLYIVNYYGTLTDTDIVKYRDNWKNIIIDHAQDFFRFPVEGVDTLYTCRKYFGVSDGAYLYTNTMIERKLENDCSNDRMQYILGRYEKTASEYYEQYLLKEHEISQKKLLQMSKVTRNILKAIDYNAVKERRTANYMYLHSTLGKCNMINVDNIVGSFAYPLYIKEAKKLRQRLIERKIYIPVLWPEVLKHEKEESIEYGFANNILPLPCDQRYGKEEMQTIVDVILDYMK